MGGICIFLGLLIPYLILSEFDKFSSVLLITSFLILIHGVLDDWRNLKPKTKIFFQVFVSAIMIYLTDVKLESFGDLFGLSYPLQLGIYSIPVTIIAVIALTNAINMMDGLDGLASVIVLLCAGLVSLNLTQELSIFNCFLLVTTSALLPHDF